MARKSINNEGENPSLPLEIDEAIKLEKEVTVIALKAKHLIEGQEYIVGGELAYVLLSKGVVVLK